MSGSKAEQKMKRTSWFIVLSLLCCITYSNNAEAQFWKNWGKKNKRKAERRKDLDGNVKPPDIIYEPINKGNESKPVVQPKKNRYRIDLLMPLYMNELVENGEVKSKGNLPNKVLSALYFYEGLKLAADTLKQQGYLFDIYVYDVTDPYETTQFLVRNNAFKGADLIIGFVQSKDFAVVANYAKRNNINFVSALSPSDEGVHNNPYFTLLQPTLESHCASIEKHLYAKNSTAPATLFYRDMINVDKIAYSCFMENNADRYNTISCNDMPTYSELKPYFTPNGKNIIVMSILNDRYAQNIIVKLYEWFPDYEFEVWGMPSWNDMPSLKKNNAYPNVTVYFTRPFHFDKTTRTGNSLARKYKEQYGGRAENMVYRGYETFYYYAYLLKKYGPSYNQNFRDNGGAPFTKFNIRPVYDVNRKLMYYENQHTCLYRYQSGSYMVEQ